MTAPRRAAAHPTLVAVIIGGLVLAGAIALFTVLGGADSSSGATGTRAAGKAAASTSAAPTTPAPATSSTPAKTAAPAKTTHAPKPATKKPATKKSTPKSLPAPARRSVTYVVKRGDTLTVIAAWFHQHGYGDLYDRNRHVIGSDPDRIFPGERITISGGRMSVSG